MDGFSAEILENGSQVEFPRGSKVAQGRADRRKGIMYTPLANALEEAVQNFTAEFGRDPKMDKVLFRGFYTSFECLVEICEVPD